MRVVDGELHGELLPLILTLLGFQDTEPAGVVQKYSLLFEL